MINELENLDSTNEELETTDSENGEESEEYTDREKQLYARLKKTEQELKELKLKPVEKVETKASPKVTANLSAAEVIALSKANIDPEDIDEVLEYAEYKKISVLEALKSHFIQATLSQKTEERNSAEAIAKPGRRGSSKLSDKEVLALGDKGEIPEELMERYAELRLTRKNR